MAGGQAGQVRLVVKVSSIKKFVVYSVGNWSWQFGSKEMTRSGNSENNMKKGSEKRRFYN